MSTKRRPLDQAEIDAANKLKTLWKDKQAAHRAKHGRILSQEQAAFEMGWQTQSAFYQYLSAKLALNLDTLLKFSAYFNVQPDEIAPELAQKLRGSHYELKDNKLTLVREEPSDYKPSLNKPAMDKATAFLFENFNDIIEFKGPQWTSQMILKLYDLFLDPASENLNKTTILKLVSNG